MVKNNTNFNRTNFTNLQKIYHYQKGKTKYFQNYPEISQIFIGFTLIGIHAIKANTRHILKRKTSTNRSKHKGNLFRKSLQLEVLVNSRLKDF